MEEREEVVRWARNDEPCAFCAETPASGAWGRPCEPSPDRLHWSAGQLYDDARIRERTVAQYVRRAAYELEKAAKAGASLAPRIQRRLPWELSPEHLSNEAERARDVLHVHGLLDV